MAVAECSGETYCLLKSLGGFGSGGCVVQVLFQSILFFNIVLLFAKTIDGVHLLSTASSMRLHVATVKAGVILCRSFNCAYYH